MSSPDDPFHHLRDFNVIVTFFPIGAAPRLKVSKFTIPGTLSIGELTAYVNKMLRIPETAKSAQRAHLYFNQSIELMDDQIVGDFARIFGKPVDKDMQINVNYSVGKAYM
jgi:hypothetical protein